MEKFEKYLGSLNTEDFGFLVNLSSMFLTDEWDDKLTVEDFRAFTVQYGISYQQACNCILLELACRWGDSVDG